jgi:hypothetical protein
MCSSWRSLRQLARPAADDPISPGTRRGACEPEPSRRTPRRLAPATGQHRARDVAPPLAVATGRRHRAGFRSAAHRGAAEPLGAVGNRARVTGGTVSATCSIVRNLSRGSRAFGLCAPVGSRWCGRAGSAVTSLLVSSAWSRSPPRSPRWQRARGSGHPRRCRAGRPSGRRPRG